LLNSVNKYDIGSGGCRATEGARGGRDGHRAVEGIRGGRGHRAAEGADEQDRAGWLACARGGRTEASLSWTAGGRSLPGVRRSVPSQRQPTLVFHAGERGYERAEEGATQVW
jgi:hypothetical protein